MKDVRQVLVWDIPDKLGELGRACRRVADAGVNIDLLYVAAVIIGEILIALPNARCFNS